MSFVQLIRPLLVQLYPNATTIELGMRLGRFWSLMQLVKKIWKTQQRSTVAGVVGVVAPSNGFKNNRLIDLKNKIWWGTV